MLPPRQSKSLMRSLQKFTYSILQPKVWIPTSICVAVILFLWEYIDNPDFMISILSQDDMSAIETSQEKTDPNPQESPEQIANNPNNSTPSPSKNTGNTLVNFGTQTANFLTNNNTKLNPSLVQGLINPSETNNKTQTNPAEVNLFLDAFSNSTELQLLNNNTVNNNKQSNNENLALNLLTDNSSRTSLIKSLTSLRQDNNSTPENPLQAALSTAQLTNILNSNIIDKQNLTNLTNSDPKNPANTDKKLTADLSLLLTGQSVNTSTVDELLTPAGKANPLLRQSSPTASPLSPNLPSASSINNTPNISIDASSEADKITPKLPGLNMPQSSGISNSGNYNQYTVISTPGTNSYNYLIQGTQQSVTMPLAPPVQSIIPSNTNVNTIPSTSLPSQNSPSRKGFSNLNTNNSNNNSSNNQLPQLQPGLVPNSLNSNGQNNQNNQTNNTYYIPNNINNGFQSNQVIPNQNLQVSPLSVPNSIPGQYIGGGQINTFSNPGTR